MDHLIDSYLFSIEQDSSKADSANEAQDVIGWEFQIRDWERGDIPASVPDPIEDYDLISWFLGGMGNREIALNGLIVLEVSRV